MTEVTTTQPQLETYSEENNDLKVLSLRFEKQSFQIVVGTDKGYRLVNYFDPSRPTVKRGLLDKSINFIELVPKTKILIYVTTDAPMNLNFYEYHPTAAEFIRPKIFTYPIVALRTSISRIAITIESGIYLFSSKLPNFMQKLHFILFNIPNPDGLVDLSEHDFNTYLAYPCSDLKGDIEIFDCLSLKSKLNFEAHVNAVVAISFSPTGRSVATASERGTIIRVHMVFTGDCIYEFRRSLRSACINSLGFGLNSTFLGVTSDAATVHIFKLVSPRNPSASGPSVILDVIQRAAEAYLPTELNKLLKQERAFAYANLPVPKMDTISLVHKIRNRLYLVVATFDGFVYTYTIDEAKGGECPLLKAVGIENDNSLTLDEEWVIVEPEPQEDIDHGF